MNTQQLDYFLYAAECLNFTKVAAKFYTTQPTVSRQISALEDELGFLLFERDKGNTRLTPSGAIMAQEMRNVRRFLSVATARAAAIAKTLSGDLNIGYLSGMDLDRFIYPLIEIFSKRYENVTIHIQGLSFSSLREKLMSKDLDLIFSYNFDLRNMGEILYERCFSVNSGLLISAEHELADKPDLQYSDFSNSVFLLPNDDDSSGRDADLFKVCSACGIKNYRIRQLGDIESVLLHVKMGDGVAVISDAMKCANDPYFRFCVLPQDKGTTFVACGWKMGNLNPILATFLEMVRGYVKKEIN